MLTPFGKAVRKLRVENEALMRDMAIALGVSSAYLSAIEMGRKKLTDDLVEKFIRYFRDLHELTQQQEMALRNAAKETSRQIQISITKSASASARKAAAVFARNFESISADQADKIIRILEKGNKGENQ